MRTKIISIAFLVYGLLGGRSGHAGLSYHERDSLLMHSAKNEKTAEFEIVQDKTDLSFFFPSFAKKQTIKVRLDNGLEVYLISDPQATQATAGLSVEVGSWDDPYEFPGMAHFVEHLVFMGTKKYPDEGEYGRFVLERDGECNAYTFHDRTVYGFAVQADSYEEALDRFSGFFTHPLFSKESIEKEIFAVDHEFEDHVENDAVRVWRVLKETGNSAHPNAVFSCGNKESLKEVEREDIQKWFSSHYHANHMHLVLQSPHSLREQLLWVVKYFSSIPKGESKRSTYAEPITSKGQQGHVIYVSPSHKGRSLELMWEVPVEVAAEDGKRALALVQEALSYAGPNCLEKVLQQEKLAHSFIADYWKIEKNHALFILDIELTKKGVQEINTVILRCFQAIEELKKKGMPSYIYDRIYEQEMQEPLLFSTLSPFDSIMKAASSMIDEDLETYPEKKCVPSGFDSQFVSRFIESLSPETCLYFVVAPFQEVRVTPTAIEKWMGSPYVIREFSDDVITSWNHPPLHPSMEVCTKSIDLEDELMDLLDKGEQINYASSFILESDMAEIHLYDQNKEYNRYGSACFCIKSPYFNSTLKHIALTQFFLSLLEEKLQTYFDENASRFDMQWLMMQEDEELIFFVKCDKRKMKPCLEEFFSQIKQTYFSLEAFEACKDRYIESFRGDPDPLEYAQIIAETILNRTFFTHAELQQAIRDVTYSEFMHFSKEFFSKIHVNALFEGPFVRNEVYSTWTSIEKILDAKPYVVMDRPKEGSQLSLMLQSGPFVVHQHTHRKGGALLLLIDAGSYTRAKWTLQRLASLLLQQEFFDELRTKQQTAYRLYSWEENNKDRLLQFIGLQSSTYHPANLLFRVEQFLDDFAHNFRTKIPAERVNQIKQIWMSKLMKLAKSAEDAEDKQIYHDALQSLRTISYEKVARFIEENFTTHNKRRLAILVEGTGPSQGQESLSHVEASYTPLESGKTR